MTDNNLLEKKTIGIEEPRIGTIKISEDVVATIAGNVASETSGVAGMSGGVSADIAEKLGRKNLAKGVKVDVGEKEAAIDLYLIVEYGAKIPEIAREIQKNVKSTIETMTGLRVIEVNIHIQGISIEKQEHKKKE